MIDEVDVPDVLVTYNGLCSSLCGPVNAAAETDEPMIAGDTVSGTTVYNDAPPAIDTTTLSNQIWMTIPDGVPLYPGSVYGSRMSAATTAKPPAASAAPTRRSSRT